VIPRKREDQGVMRGRILSVIRAHIEKHGYSPTVRDIGAVVGLSSPDTVQYHLNRLRSAGLITRDTKDRKRARTVRMPY